MGTTKLNFTSDIFGQHALSSWQCSDSKTRKHMAAIPDMRLVHFNTVREIFVNFLLLDWSIVFQQFWNCDVFMHASVNWLSLMSRIIQSSKYNTADSNSCPPYEATKVLLELACLLMSRIKKSLLYHSTKASRSSWTNPLDSRCHALIIFGWYDKT